MFAVIRTGGKQYRVGENDRIVVERLDGEVGDTVTLSDVLLIGQGSELGETSGRSVTARIVAQQKGEKVIIFKKKRRHNYRRKRGHRQHQTVLEIVSLGGPESENRAA